ncbi:MAG: hypothetical protein ABI824_00230 [Acidobacteriota bacterium]
MKKLITLTLCVASFALTAFAEKVTLATPMWVGGTELKAGDYKVELKGDKVVFMDRKVEVASAPAKLETGTQKFAYTTLETAASKVSAIRLAGTSNKIVITGSSASATATGN